MFWYLLLLSAFGRLYLLRKDGYHGKTEITFILRPSSLHPKQYAEGFDCLYVSGFAGGVFEQYQMTKPLAAISAWTAVFFGLCALLYWCMMKEYQQTQDAWHWASDGYERQLRFFALAGAAMAVFNAVKCAAYFIGS